MFGNPDKLEPTMGFNYTSRFGSAAIKTGRTTGTCTERDGSFGQCGTIHRHNCRVDKASWVDNAAFMDDAQFLRPHVEHRE